MKAVSVEDSRMNPDMLSRRLVRKGYQVIVPPRRGGRRAGMVKVCRLRCLDKYIMQ